MIQIFENHVRLRQVATCLFILYFCFWWGFKLEILPGLHGDEAWAGLKAHQYNNSGIDHVYGMNTYTGILQPLVSSWLFNFMNIGVCQLRMAGPIFNMMGLLILCLAFRSYKNGVSSFFFILILAQSALYLISPRVAWEVNTFTLFFLSLAAWATVHIIADLTCFKPFWVGLFLLANLLGTYNHVLFSCISLAALVGVVLWSLYNGTPLWKRMILILAINLFNLLFLFMVMRFWSNGPLLKTPIFFFISILLLVILQTKLLKHMCQVNFRSGLSLKLSAGLTFVILGGFLISFLTFHGMALYQVFSNYNLITHAYSYSFSPVTTFLFLAGGGTVCGYFIFFLGEDVKNKRKALFAFFIIVYLGLISVYTTDNSFRYYLSAYVIIGIYLAVKISAQLKRALPLVTVMTIMAILVNVVLLKIFLHPDRPVKAIEFTVGNRQIETSAHFLPSKPLISFLRENQIGNIFYLSNRYFLERPILFYSLINPWKQSPNNTAIIDYDYTGNKHGYLLYKKE